LGTALLKRQPDRSKNLKGHVWHHEVFTATVCVESRGSSPINQVDTVPIGDAGKQTMASVVLYFQLHQPYRLRRYTAFDSGNQYFDDESNTALLNRISDKCYIPATSLILDMVKRHDGRFKLAFSLSGCIIDQFRDHRPEVLNLFEKLAKTGSVEFLSETYYHSLASQYSTEEFEEQVRLHDKLIHDLFGQTPRVFRNTELIYDNKLGQWAANTGRYVGMLSEGADKALAGRTPNRVYRSVGSPSIPLLLKNYRLSDDIAFRFSNRQWPEWPLTAEKFARWITSQPDAQVCNLFMDYETFGEHQWAETGIFKFLEAFPEKLLELTNGWDFQTPTEAFASYKPTDTYHVEHAISWADSERDLSAWAGNAMQLNALRDYFKLEQQIKASDNPGLLRDWRRIGASDHAYYMCTKYFADGEVHKYFNPYQSPYDSYINFMNVIDSLRNRSGALV
jgi:alpha-amylase